MDNGKRHSLETLDQRIAQWSGTKIAKRNCYLRQGKIFRHHNPRKRLFLGIFSAVFAEKMRLAEKVVGKKCVSREKSLEKVAFPRKSPLKKLRFLQKVV